MAPPYSAKAEREKRRKSLLAFALSLSNRFSLSCDATLLDDLQAHICSLPLPPSSANAAKQDEFDRIGTELWNISTRLRREDDTNTQNKDDSSRRSRSLCLLRVFAFLLLDTAGRQATKAQEWTHLTRLMKVALKAAKVCIENNELDSATKVLEKAAGYQEAMIKDPNVEHNEETQLGENLRVEYFAIRITLAWRQDRMDTAEHMFAKYRQMSANIGPKFAEDFADLLYDIGDGLLAKRNYELAVGWLEKAYDVLGEQDLEVLGPDAGELRLSIMRAVVQAYMNLETSEAEGKAWDMFKLLEADFGEKMTVQLLKLELLSSTKPSDSNQYYFVLLRLIRTAVLNESNFRTIMHHVHILKEHNNATACKAVDDLIEIRLFREDNQNWIEKAVITRIWICTTSTLMEDTLGLLQELFDSTSQNSKHPLSAPATHAAQTLLWKRVEVAYRQEQFAVAESWCRICLHQLFDKAGELNKSKIARKLIICALSRQDYESAREVFLKMSSTGKDEAVTRYLMYKVALHSSDSELASDCLDLVCRQSANDATLLYACVMEAQSVGDKRQAISALERVLDRYNYDTPTGIQLPALLRCTARLLMSELLKDGRLELSIVEEICKLFDGACNQAKASRRRPTTPEKQLFTPLEFEWFAKNAYNLSLKYCADMHPANLVTLLNACSEFTKLLRDQNQPENSNLSYRLMFCDFLAACAFTTLARAEDNKHDHLQYYLEARKHSQAFRTTAAECFKDITSSDARKDDIIAKHFQVVKIELEAIVKLERWDELDELFEECWKYENKKPLETLADLVLVIYNTAAKANLDGKYQDRISKVLQKIITLTWRQSNNDISKLSKWIRCLFQLALTFDESVSLKCLDQASQIAAARQGEQNHYPSIELEWLATVSYNHGVDYYLQENDEKCKLWAEKAIGLSQWAEDGGRLRGQLMEKYSGLVWSDNDQ